MQQQLIFGSRTLAYELYYSERKTLGIQVHPSGKIAVTAPRLSRLSVVKEKVQLKAPWIIKQLNQVKKYHPKAHPRRYLSGETHLYLGRQYRLKIVKSEINEVSLYRGYLWLRTKNSTMAAHQKQLDAWYTQKAKEVFTELLLSILPRFKRYKLQQPTLIVRKMTKRWGSCTPTGKIILNLELIKAPKGCIEYVIIHELCHLVHHNHTRQFYQLLSRMMPDWEKRKGQLEKS